MAAPTARPCRSSRARGPARPSRPGAEGRFPIKLVEKVFETSVGRAWLAEGMAEPLTLMAVHAHPDDEASGGGILAGYSDQGVQTIVVTCTNGEYGDAPGGIKPGQEGHDP